VRARPVVGEMTPTHEPTGQVEAQGSRSDRPRCNGSLHAWAGVRWGSGEVGVAISRRARGCNEPSSVLCHPEPCGPVTGIAAPFRILADHERDRRPRTGASTRSGSTSPRARRTLEWSRGLRARMLPEERERTDDELAEEADPAEEVAVLEAEVWSEAVRRGLNVVVLAAVEAPALGGAARTGSVARRSRRSPMIRTTMHVLEARMQELGPAVPQPGGGPSPDCSERGCCRAPRTRGGRSSACEPGVRTWFWWRLMSLDVGWRTQWPSRRAWPIIPLVNALDLAQPWRCGSSLP
jgi:hypothetical protein